MTLKNIINDICEYAVKNDLCNTSMGGLSLYDINFKQDNLYSLIFVAPAQNHNITNNTIDYNFRLYYLDRLLRDNDNNLDIFNASVLNLSKLINIIKEFNGVLKINNDYQIVNFADTQRLTDNVVGSYVDITVTVLNTNGICASDAILPTINVIKINYQNKDINITENGDYNVTYDNGYNALKEVNINVNIDTDSYYNDGFNNGKIEGYNEGYSEGEINGREEQKSLLEAIKITENGIYDNENGYDEVTVEIDTQSYYDNGYNTGYNEGEINGKEEQKSLIQPITITENGTYTNENGYSPINVNLDTQSYYDNGYNDGTYAGYNNGYNNGYNEGYSNGEVNGIEQGKEEQKNLLTSITITDNGNYTNENGYNEVIVNVGGTPKPKLPNGINLQNSTFTTIDMSNWNWSNVYDWSEMFWDCSELTEITNFPSNIEIYGAKGMFYNTNLNSIPELDTSKCVTMENMFSSIDDLTTIPMLNTSNVINMNNMFSGCGNLTEIPMLDTSNVLTMNRTFSFCTNLTSIPLLNTSNVTNMEYMFRECRNLTSIPELDTSKCTNMDSMFRECTNLTSIPELDTSKCTNMDSMFYNCISLEEVKFKGNPKNLKNKTSIWNNAGSNIENPKMYYPQEYADSYQQIINALPSNWSAIPY